MAKPAPPPGKAASFELPEEPATLETREDLPSRQGRRRSTKSMLGLGDLARDDCVAMLVEAPRCARDVLRFTAEAPSLALARSDCRASSLDLAAVHTLESSIRRRRRTRAGSAASSSRSTYSPSASQSRASSPARRLCRHDPAPSAAPAKRRVPQLRPVHGTATAGGRAGDVDRHPPPRRSGGDHRGQPRLPRGPGQFRGRDDPLGRRRPPGESYIASATKLCAGVAHRSGARCVRGAGVCSGVGRGCDRNYSRLRAAGAAPRPFNSAISISANIPRASRRLISAIHDS